MTWTPEEDEFLIERRSAGCSYEAVRDALVAAGYPARSFAAIASRAWKFGFLARNREAMPSPMPFASTTMYPLGVRAALHQLAESNPNPAEYEARKAEILRESR